MESLLDDMADGLSSGDIDVERAERWRTAGGNASRRSSGRLAVPRLSAAENSLPFNPRRLLPANHGYLTFGRYRRNLDAMERTVLSADMAPPASLGSRGETENTYTPVFEAYAHSPYG